jgi:hypothetical protein
MDWPKVKKVYLQLYNLVESTVVQCLDELSVTTIGQGQWAAAELSDLLRKEWIKVSAKTHRSLTPDNRLAAVLSLCDVILNGAPVESFKIGSWDDESIEKVLRRIGCDLFVPPAVRTDIKRKFRNDLGAMTLVRNMRNMLAHGTISFAECGENHTVGELREMVRRTSPNGGSCGPPPGRYSSSLPGTR